jgi:hypothetical protein
MAVADGVPRGADDRPLSRGDRVTGEIETGIHVVGEVMSIVDGNIVVVWNENESEPRKRSGKHHKFSQEQ